MPKPFSQQLKLLILSAAVGSIQATAAEAPSTFKQYCFACHGKAASMAGLNLEALTASSVGENFQKWDKVAEALEQRHMPPKKMPQPSDTDRQHAVAWIRGTLEEYAQKHAGDPGRVTVRRLTAGEYAYTIRDLTGIDLRFDNDSASDAVGGEGFTNFGDVQFMQDANVERYLEAAKKVANHAVIGAGPLGFYDDPGKSGFELSAASRIAAIYRANGFRSVAGEGAKPYGVDRYSKALYAAWRYKHRVALGEPKLTLQQAGEKEGLTPRFTQHIWSVVSAAAPTYPSSDIVARWRKLPAPGTAQREDLEKTIRAGCGDIQNYLMAWTRGLFGAGPLGPIALGDDRIFLLTEETVNATTKQTLRFNIRRNGADHKPRLYLSAADVNPNAKDKPLVIWRNPTVRYGNRGTTSTSAVAKQPQQPLRPMLDAATVEKLGFGKHPDGREIGPDEFVMANMNPVGFELPMPAGVVSAEFQIEAEIVPGAAKDTVLRAAVSDNQDSTKGRATTPALLAIDKSPAYLAWKAGVLEFGRNLPQNSHNEATPSDRDPIRLPFNNAYNQPERDFYHIKLKYYRDDRFIVEKVLDDASRVKLDQAWADLYASFEYHEIFKRYLADKYKLDIKDKNIEALTVADFSAMPEEPRKYLKELQAEYNAVQRAQRLAQPRHVEDSLEFASRAWRRPLSEPEKAGLRAFYTKIRTGPEVDHATAIRSLLARVLVAPAFLYRLEQPVSQGVRPLSDWEIAGRLSYFLWSSIPDAELRRAAAAKELSRPDQIERQVKRMLGDPKARRFSTEFFGQWLGFYRFDQYNGVDTTRFPEFTEEVKTAMYDEAVSFFEHVVRKDRPVREMLSADYTFVNKALAKHYGIKKDLPASDKPELLEGASAYGRGGMLRLGAVLTATSAPLRTSPVKRGDWVLRRILGTPTPPPPADAGSIPADDKNFGGMTVFERLQAHQRNPTCANCHSRIDPLGFPLERYDSVGRVREKYADGKPIQDWSAAADQTTIAGVDGLLGYLQRQEKLVMRTLSYKLLGYALGRTILASDQPLVHQLTKGGGETTFSKLVADIATSKQFRYRREAQESSGPAKRPEASEQTARTAQLSTPSRSAESNPAKVSTPAKQGGGL